MPVLPQLKQNLNMAKISHFSHPRGGFETVTELPLYPMQQIHSPGRIFYEHTEYATGRLADQAKNAEGTRH